MSNRQIYRNPRHDYRSRCVYMLTLSKSPAVENFGLVVHSDFANNRFAKDTAVVFSNLGKAVKDAIRIFPTLNPAIRILQFVVMPDHIHLLVHVTAPVEMTIGQYVATWKTRVNKLAGQPVFQTSFNDQILYSWRSLDAIYRYIRENPYRLLVRKENPDFFSSRQHIRINGADCQAYGNLQLLDNPFKDAVTIHRADSQAEREGNRLRWLHTAANGGVLVSPFVSKDEKAIRKEAEDLEARIILITHEAFPERFKPAAHDFQLCTEGRLLIISLGHRACTPLTRPLCLSMNTLAQALARSGSPLPS